MSTSQDKFLQFYAGVGLYIIVFISGMAALSFEIVYLKLLTYVLGSSSVAASAVLSAFMAGLGIGGYYGGKWAHFLRKPLNAYGLIEISIGLISVCFPLLISISSAFYGGLTRGQDIPLPVLTSIRFALSFIIVLSPTILMGATLPVLVSFLARTREELGIGVSRIYGFNTLGAAFGALLANYFFIPNMGLQGTLILGLSFNIIVAVGAWVLNHITPLIDLPSSGEVSYGKLQPVYIFISALSGFVSLGFEVTWVHLLALLVGTSVYAFGLMLFTFLIGLGISAIIFSYLLKYDWPIGRFYLGIQAGILFSISLTMPLWDKMPAFFSWVGLFNPSFFLMEMTRLFVTMVLLLLTTIFLGMTFPLLMRMTSEHRQSSPRNIGILYLSNTVGGVIGSLATGYFLIDAIGSQHLMIFFGLVSIVGGMFLWIYTERPLQWHEKYTYSLFSCILFALLFVFRVDWNKSEMIRGTNVYFSSGFGEIDELIYYKEDIRSGTVSVISKKGVKTLLTNGKFEGNDGFERFDQEMAEAIPAMLVNSYNRALNIGIGTGNALAVLGHLPFKELFAMDISPGIIEAADLHFRHINKGIFQDPRITLAIEDGRDFLTRNSKPFDLITMQLTSIWFKGSGNLYTREFYQLCRNNLTEHGVFKTVIQLHHFSWDNLINTVATFLEVFPHASLWHLGHQGILIGTMDKQPFNMKTLRRNQAYLYETFKQNKIGHLREFFQLMKVDTEGLHQMVNDYRSSGNHLRINYDIFPMIEYSTPKGNSLERSYKQNSNRLESYDLIEPENYFLPRLSDEELLEFAGENIL